MSDCVKSQREKTDGVEQRRCIHNQSELFRQVVVPDQCASCPVKILAKQKVKPCTNNHLPVIEPREGGYPACPYRFGERPPTCSVTRLDVTPEICNRCIKETREHEATLSDKVSHYFGAVRRWVASGRPIRSKEEIEQLFQDHCKQCDKYDSGKHACKNCGCTVTEDVTPLGNKLAMKTEHCPLGRF